MAGKCYRMMRQKKMLVLLSLIIFVFYVSLKHLSVFNFGEDDDDDDDDEPDETGGTEKEEEQALLGIFC